MQGSQPVGNLLNACGVQRRSVRYRGYWTPPPAACQTPRRPSPKAPSMGADLDRTSACARTMLGIFEPECRVPGLRQSAAALLRQIALGRAYLDGSQPKPSPAASAASAGLARSTLRCKSQPTLWGHASRVPGRGLAGAVPLRSPGGPRSGGVRGRGARPPSLLPVRPESRATRRTYGGRQLLGSVAGTRTRRGH